MHETIYWNDFDFGNKLEGWVAIKTQVCAGDRVAALWPRIFLNGVEQQYVTMADPRRGVLTRDMIRDDGTVVIEHGRPKQETCYGHVEVYIREGEGHYYPDLALDGVWALDRALHVWIPISGLLVLFALVVFKLAIG